MELLLLSGLIVGGAVLYRRRQGNRPTATTWEKGVASDLLDKVALEEARAAVLSKLQHATAEDAPTAARRK